MENKQLISPVMAEDLYKALVEAGIIPAGAYTHISVSGRFGELARIELRTDHKAKEPYYRLEEGKGLKGGYYVHRDGMPMGWFQTAEGAVAAVNVAKMNG